MSPEELCQAVLSGLGSSNPAVTLEFLGLAEQLGLQTREDVWTPLNASLAAQYRSLFHHVSPQLPLSWEGRRKSMETLAARLQETLFLFLFLFLCRRRQLSDGQP